jgi:hypothetical protein
MPPSSEQQSVIRVRRALEMLGARGQVRALADSARTAKEAADALGIEVGQIASSLVFLADGEPALIIASGGHRVDTMQLASILEVNQITKASADQVRKATGFAASAAHDRGHRPVEIQRGLGGGRPSALRLPHELRRVAPHHRR